MSRHCEVFSAAHIALPHNSCSRVKCQTGDTHVNTNPSFPMWRSASTNHKLSQQLLSCNDLKHLFNVTTHDDGNKGRCSLNLIYKSELQGTDAYSKAVCILGSQLRTLRPKVLISEYLGSALVKCICLQQRLNSHLLFLTLVTSEVQTSV